MSLRKVDGYTLGIIMASFAVLVVFNILYTNYVQRESDQKWCALMVGLDDRYQALQTSDPNAIRFKQQIHDLRRSLGCAPSPAPPSVQNVPSVPASRR